MRIEFLRRFISHFPPELSLMLFGIKFYTMDPRRINNLLKRVKRYENSPVLDTLSDKEKKRLLKELRNYCVFCSHVGAEEYLDSYFEGKELECIKQSEPNIANLKRSDPILICCIKNDLTRIRQIYEQHRGLGIKKMVFVDNESDDGTREWLASQNVDLYSVDEKYHAGRKSAWIRKVIDIYGYNRWYLVVDSDELVSYIGSEKHNINEFVEYAMKCKYDRVGAFLLDMYPSHNIYEESSEENFVLDNRFFDTDSYYLSRDGRGFMLRGGPRKRVFENGMDHTEPLSKYALFYAKIEDLWSDHRPLPFKKNFNSQCLFVLRHYKFMVGDYEKYLKIASDGNYYNGSANYKIYTSGGKSISFMYENSCEYVDSNSLRCLKFLEEADWS